MGQYLIDTNVVSGILYAKYSEAAMKFLATVIDEMPNMSVISQIELLSWNSELEATDFVKSFIEESRVLNIDNKTIEICVELRRTKKIKTPDAIIAATALANNYTIITNNEKDFSNIKGLDLINPARL